MTLAIVQARLGSTRFPNKVLADFRGKPMVEWVVRAAVQAGCVVKVAFPAADEATFVQAVHHPLWAVQHPSWWDYETWCPWHFHGWAGPEDDCLGRVASAARGHKGKIVRLTGDCPLLQPSDIADALDASHGLPYFWNANSVPHGRDVEVWDADYLQYCAETVTDAWCREHVKPCRIPTPERPNLPSVEVNTPEDLCRLTSSS